MDGTVRPWGNIVDNQQLIKPFSAQKDNLKDFYDLGTTLNNSLSISGGNEKATFFVSYNNVDADGIIPTDADSYKRNAFTLKGVLNLRAYR